MLGIINYKLFIISSILLNLTPGADTIYILGKGISKGKKAAIISALGISTGCMVHTVLAAFGLSVILSKSSKYPVILYEIGLVLSYASLILIKE